MHSNVNDKTYATDDCPCGSGKRFTNCCEPALTGKIPARTAQALMRSRYSAFYLHRYPYLISTLHPSKRDGLTAQKLAEEMNDTQWLGLEITQTKRGGVEDQEGEVSFVASFSEPGRQAALKERSRFIRENGEWFYLDGDTRIIAAQEPGRNAPCPCGSGKKFKRCCGG